MGGSSSEPPHRCPTSPRECWCRVASSRWGKCIQIRRRWEVDWPSSARRTVDDSKGKAIGSDDCHMTPVREGPVRGPIHRLHFFDPVLCGLLRFLRAISCEYCLVKGSELPLCCRPKLGNLFGRRMLSVNDRIGFVIAHGTYLLIEITCARFVVLEAQFR
jgi:hypothetical protein